MWKSIDGYEGYYEVSDDGRVRSLDRYVDSFGGRKRKLKGKTMKLTIAANGYYVVNLRRDRTSKVCCVHVLVANAFIENKESLPTVNHKDGNKLNNRVSNLEWVSYGDNNIHALSHELRKPRGVSVIQFNMNNEYIAEYRSVTEAYRETGISRESISQCVNNYTHSAGGYLWKKNSKGLTTISQESTQEISTCGSASHPELDEDIVCTIRNDG